MELNSRFNTKMSDKAPHENLKEKNDSDEKIKNNSDIENEIKKEVKHEVKRPHLSFGISQILGCHSRTRSRSSSPSCSKVDVTDDEDERCESDVDVNDSDHELSDSDAQKSPSHSVTSSPTLSASKYEEALQAHARSMYPLDLTGTSLFPLGAACGLYRTSAGLVKVPAQRPHPVLHMLNPYNIPWIDFRRDRFGGKTEM